MDLTDKDFKGCMICLIDFIYEINTPLVTAAGGPEAMLKTLEKPEVFSAFLFGVLSTLDAPTLSEAVQQVLAVCMHDGAQIPEVMAIMKKYTRGNQLVIGEKHAKSEHASGSVH